MAVKNQHGKDLAAQLASSRTALQQTGIYMSAGEAVRPLPTLRDSPSDFDDEGDYDDGGVVTMESPAIEMKNQTAPFISKSKERNDCGKLHITILYALVAICFIIWMVLFFSVLKKNSTLSEELQNLHFNYLEKFVKVMKDLDYVKTTQRIIQRTTANSITEIQDIKESFCDKRNFSCPTNWKTQGKYCYYFSSKRETWINALWHCIKQRAYLVSIWSDEEQGFLKNSLNGTYWLGMTDLGREGEWRWIEGDWLETITFWDIGEPRMEINKDCGIMHPNGTWASAVCSLPNRWICKKKGVC